MIGLGVGEAHIIGLQSHPNCQVVAICDLDEETLREVSPKYPSCRPTNEPNSVLDDPSIDLICIASNDDAHEPQVIRALRNNKHVFVEILVPTFIYHPIISLEKLLALLN